MGQVTIREARTEECEALTALALSAKASWGYDAAFMAACRAELTITAQSLADWRVWVADDGTRVAGMIALSAKPGHAELEDFFVAPDTQGRGVGRALMDAFLAECSARGLSRVEVDADPNAEPIYARLGFRTIGRSPSGSIPGRFLPRMARDLGPHIDDPA